MGRGFCFGRQTFGRILSFLFHLPRDNHSAADEKVPYCAAQSYQYMFSDTAFILRRICRRRYCQFAGLHKCEINPELKKTASLSQEAAFQTGIRRITDVMRSRYISQVFSEHSHYYCFRPCLINLHEVISSIPFCFLAYSCLD